jgi:iron complex outermembrane receptor protein
MDQLLQTTCRSLVGIAAFITASVHAQSANTSSSAPASASDVLESVVVTAQRREERAVDVPITVTSISAEQLENADIQQASDLARITPALRFDRESSFVQPTIRGVGTSLVTSGGGANVGIYVDGFYSPNPLAAEFDLLNVQSVQVLKGPQGTLFGRNTTGGAILLSTAEPSTESSAIVQASYGRFNTQRYQAYGTVGLSDNIAFDIEGLLSQGDGHVTDAIGGNDDVAKYENSTVRAGLKADVGEAASFLLRYTHSSYDDPTYMTGQPFVIDGVPWATPTFLPSTVYTTDPDRLALSFQPYSTVESDVLQLTGTFNLDFGTLRSYTQYREESHKEQLDVDGTSAPFLGIIIPIEDQVFTQEFLLTSKPGSDLQWTAGLFYMSYQDDFRNNAISQGGGPFFVFANSSTTTESSAGFLDLTYEVSPQFFVTAGVRYTRDEIKDAFYSNPTLTGLVQVDVPTLTESRVTPRVVLRYKPTEESSVYASFTKGYKAPIYNVGGNTSVPVDAESINAYETGYKFAGRMFTFDISAFYYDYSDLQVATYNGTQSLINNAANSTIKGAETALRFQITDGLSLNAGAAYTDAKFDEYASSPYFTPGTLLIQSLPADGNQMPRAPELTGTLGLQYTVPIGAGSIALAGNLYHTSSFFFDSSNQFKEGGYDLLNLRAEWTSESERLMLALSADNVTDERYRLMANAGESLAVRTVWNYPAMYSATVRVKF